MFETVTVKQALSKGQRIVNLPVFGIMFGGFGLIGLLSWLFPDWVAAFCLIGLVLAIGGAWVYWSFAITKWKVWAFDNVRNVHQLKQDAIKAQLIWPDDSFFNKTEIWTRTDRAKWESLQTKFQQADYFEEDFNVPGETIIGFSNKKALGDIIALVLLMAGGIYLLLETDRFIWGWVCVVGAPLYFIVDTRKKLKNKTPQIIINNKGMQAGGMPFLPWDMINNEEVTFERNGQHANRYLEYRHPTGYFKMDIQPLDISQQDLENLLRTYRGRFEKNVVPALQTHQP